MKILVTGAKGMVGTALVNNLKNIRDGKNKTRPNLHIEEIYEYDLYSTAEELDAYCQKAGFVFNLAGVNRPENPEDFMKGNFGFASDLLNCLKKHKNKARKKAAKKQKQGKADGGRAFAGALEKAPVFEEGGLLLAGRYGGQDYFFKGEHADGALEVRAENDGTAARAASPGEPGVRGGSLPETEGGGNA